MAARMDTYIYDECIWRQRYCKACPSITSRHVSQHVGGDAAIGAHRLESRAFQRSRLLQNPGAVVGLRDVDRLHGLAAKAPPVHRRLGLPSVKGGGVLDDDLAQARGVLVRGLGDAQGLHLSILPALLLHVLKDLGVRLGVVQLLEVKAVGEGQDGRRKRVDDRRHLRDGEAAAHRRLHLRHLLLRLHEHLDVLRLGLARLGGPPHGERFVPDLHAVQPGACGVRHRRVLVHDKAVPLGVSGLAVAHEVKCLDGPKGLQQLLALLLHPVIRQAAHKYAVRPIGRVAGAAGLEADGLQIKTRGGDTGPEGRCRTGVVVVGAAHAHGHALKHDAVQGHGV
mmetsp:Transcript_33644/g.84351  ORF Transcript_33644/g.84351 Transcript_33644/m.84351 type:complete len:338 (+) Transcript_33644:846-1859(+)